MTFFVNMCYPLKATNRAQILIWQVILHKNQPSNLL